MAEENHMGKIYKTDPKISKDFTGKIIA